MVVAGNNKDWGKQEKRKQQQQQKSFNALCFKGKCQGTGFLGCVSFVFLTPGSCCTKGFETLTNTLQTQEGVLQEKGVEIMLNQTSLHFDSYSTAV